MEENVSTKYAVYIDKDGDDVLEVVRDTLDEAKADMQKLKSQTSYIRIEKANIKNFGKDDEKVVDSETVSSWDSADGKKDDDKSLSEHYKASGSGDSSSSQAIIPPVVAVAPIVAPIVSDAPVVQKEMTWQDHYAKHGALIYGVGFEELTSMKPVEVKKETPAIETPPTSTSTSPVVDSNVAPVPTVTPESGIAPPVAPPNMPVAEINKSEGLSDNDIEKIADKLKEKLAPQSAVAKVEPEKVIG